MSVDITIRTGELVRARRGAGLIWLDRKSAPTLINLAFTERAGRIQMRQFLLRYFKNLN
jgi:hypothetical protein